MNLNGKKVIVTGGAKRVGRAFCRRFASLGARVVIHYNTSEQEALLLLEELGGTGAGHSLFQCDLSEPEHLAERVVPFLKEASLLVNSASVFCRRTLKEETLPEAQEQFRINFFAPVELMKLFAQHHGPDAAVINILDQGISATDPVSFSYALSKKALAHATKSAALQFAPEIRVNGLAPGPVLPPSWMPESKMVNTLRHVPLGRPVALDDLCSACVFLAENESVTGTVLYVDCGQNLNS